MKTIRGPGIFLAQFIGTEPPFDRLEVRQAVNHAVDRQAIVRMYGGLAEPTQNVLPPTYPQYEKLDLYDRAGVPLVWVVHPRRRAVKNPGHVPGHAPQPQPVPGAESPCGLGIRVPAADAWQLTIGRASGDCHGGSDA